jgi:D-tagatose-1,6-bisphosphate aldolase subunit GatZ/KbaZ
VSERLTDGRAGVTSVCTAHPIAIEAALSLGHRNGRRVLIEATCNQVNQEGGYTGMTPADFRGFVETIASRVGSDPSRIILGGIISARTLGSICPLVRPWIEQER